MQIGCVEAEIRNLKENLHTKIFLIEKVVQFIIYGMFTCLTVGAVSQERLHGFECNLYPIDRR